MKSKGTRTLLSMEKTLCVQEFQRLPMPSPRLSMLRQNAGCCAIMFVT